MHKPDSVESILARLMPPAMSEAGQGRIEAMLDALASETAQAPPVQSATWLRRLLRGGMAAAAVLALLVLPLVHPPSSWSFATALPLVDAARGLVLMDESDRIESMKDEGWQDDAEGSTMRAMRLNVVKENHLFDQETGIVMQVSEPREELLLMPVSTF